MRHTAENSIRSRWDSLPRGALKRAITGRSATVTYCCVFAIWRPGWSTPLPLRGPEVGRGAPKGSRRRIHERSQVGLKPVGLGRGQAFPHCFL